MCSNDGSDVFSQAGKTVSDATNNFYKPINSAVTDYGRNISNGNFSHGLNSAGQGVMGFLNSAWKYVSGQSYQEKQTNEQNALHKAAIDRQTALQQAQDRAAGIDRNASITVQAGRDTAAAVSAAAVGNAVLPGGGTVSTNSSQSLGGAGPSANEKDFLGI